MINIASLALSITSCIILFYIVRYELSFDNFHSNRKRIYRIVNEVQFEDRMDYGTGVPAPLPEAMRTDFPQLEQVGTIFSIPDSQIDILDGPENGRATFKEPLGVFFAEPQFFQIFGFRWLHGSHASLAGPNTAVLTRETAEKYFGSWRNAIGRSIEYRNTHTLTITGILDDITEPTDFPLKVVISFKTRGQETSGWGSITSRRQCYILLNEHTSAEQVQKMMPAFESRHHPVEQDIRDHYVLQPLDEIHFDARYSNFNNRIVTRATLWSLCLIGILLMVTASINFVNLATAQLMKRTREVGVRKVLGSSRLQLAGQFFGEISLILLVSTLLAVLLTQAVLPAVQVLLELPPSFGPSDPLEVTLFLAMLNVAIAVFSGIYPVRIMGAFKPVQALASRVSTQTVGGMSLRKSLVVAQFALAQMLVIAALIIFRQIDYFLNAPLGFDKDSIIVISLPGDSVSQSSFGSFRNHLLQHPGVGNVTLAFSPPLSESNRRTSIASDRSPEALPFEVNLKYADTAFFKTYDLSLQAGRVYQPSDTARELVVNETLLKAMGMGDPGESLGRSITVSGRTLPIVGVVKDFHLLSLQRKIEPLIIMCNRSEYREAGIKLVGGNARRSIEDLEKIYRSAFPDDVFEYQFVDEDIARQYADEERLSSITRIFSGIAIFISCLGLYGLVSFMAVQRTKEVGMRKVLGASMKDIIVLFYKEFMFLVVIAFVISAPLTAYFMADWLSTFAYAIDPGPGVFIVAIALSLVISLLTISFQIVKAALANPVESLRSE